MIKGQSDLKIYKVFVDICVISFVKSCLVLIACFLYLVPINLHTTRLYFIIPLIFLYFKCMKCLEIYGAIGFLQKLKMGEDIGLAHPSVIEEMIPEDLAHLFPTPYRC
nr:uncharacterized protein LOC117279569 [Nicotiana tomentosiformis]